MGYLVTHTGVKKEVRIEAFADDCTLFLHPTADNLKKFINVIKEFKTISGLSINLGKTTAVWFGMNCATKPPLAPELNLKWDSEFQLLGIWFTGDLTNMQRNFDEKITAVNKLIKKWIYRTLIVYGRICILKTLALPKLGYVIQVLPNPPQEKIQNLEKACTNFIWGSTEVKKKQNKINAMRVRCPEVSGGLGFVQIKTFWNALHLSWARRALQKDSRWLYILEKDLEEQLGTDMNIAQFLMNGPVFMSKLAGKLKNEFWRQTLSIFGPILKEYIYQKKKNWGRF